MRLPLATDINSRDGTLAKDSLMKNAFAEKVGDDFDVFKRPGLAQSFDLGVNQGQGMFSWKGTFFAVAGDSLSQGPTETPYPNGGTWTDVADITNTPSDDNGRMSYDAANDKIYYVSASFTRTQVGSSNWVTVQNSPVFSGGFSGPHGASVYFGGALWCFSTIVGGGAGVPSAEIFKSTDGGISFAFQANHPSPARFFQHFYVYGATLYSYGGQDSFSPLTYTGQLMKTTDGTNWSVVSSSGLPTATGNVGVAVNGTRVVVMVGTAVYSSDNGETFAQSTADAGFTVKDRMLSFHDGRLYAVSSVNGVWRGNSNGTTWNLATASPSFSASHFIKSDGTNLSVYEYIAGVKDNLWRATANLSSEASYTLTGAAGLPISFSQTSGAASTEYLFLKTTGSAWVLTFGQPGTLTQVTDVDYPATTVPGAVYLDGYFFVMTAAGEIYNSALEVPTSWGALDFISAEIEPDDAVALGKHMNYVVAFKSTTTELFYDAANASGSPLARLSNAAIQVGCANGYSIAALDAGLFFLSKFRSNQKSVHYFPKDGLQPVEIASPSIKRILTAADTSTVHCFACQLSGHSFYVVTLPTEGLTLAYDLTTQTWSQWTFLTEAAADNVTALIQSGGIATATATAHGFADGDPVTIAGATPSGYNGDVNIKYVDANTFTYPVSSALSSPATGTITATGWTAGYFPFGFYTNALGKDYIQHETSGKIYEISSDYGDDAGAPIDVTVRTPPLNQGSIEKKTMARLSVVGDNTTGTLLVRYSDDDYSTFSKYRPIDLSTTNKQVRRIGDYRERALDFRYTGDNKIRIRSIDIE